MTSTQRRLLAALLCGLALAAVGQGLAWAQVPPSPSVPAQHQGAGPARPTDGNLAANGVALSALRGGGLLSSGPAPEDRGLGSTGPLAVALRRVGSTLLTAGWAPPRPAHFRITARTHAP